jgi:hypothetical protein
MLVLRSVLQFIFVEKGVSFQNLSVTVDLCNKYFVGFL